MIEIGPNLKDVIEGVVGGLCVVFVVFLLVRNL